jgi:membrane protease YdiL (CAAX protease family)
VLAAINYGDRIASGKPPKDALYQWSTAVGSAVLFAVLASIVVLLAGGDRALLALRPPASWKRALVQMLGVLILVYAVSAVASPFLHPGREQGLTPSHWEPAHAAAFFANAVVVCVLAPFTEELTFRGLGFTLLRRFGPWLAVVATAIAFGLAHGLVEALPILVVFGIGLAYIRLRQDSIVPGMLLHATFNAVALAVAVAT